VSVQIRLLSDLLAGSEMGRDSFSALHGSAVEFLGDGRVGLG